jgi:hypothetical protein
LGTDERKLLEPRLEASAGRREAQDAPHQTSFWVVETSENAERRFE